MVALGLLTAGCTGIADSPSPTSPPQGTTTSIGSTTTTTIAPDKGAELFRSCLSGHGVEIDAIPLDATGHPRLDLATRTLDFGDPIVAEAIAACSSALVSGSLDMSDDQMLRSFVLEQLSAFSACVREKGVPDFPDPIPGFTGVGSAYSAAEIPYSNPLLPAALEICRERVLGDLPAG